MAAEYGISKRRGLYGERARIASGLSHGHAVRLMLELREAAKGTRVRYSIVKEKS